jgi:hypothetical protein
VERVLEGLEDVIGCAGYPWLTLAARRWDYRMMYSLGEPVTNTPVIG